MASPLPSRVPRPGYSPPNFNPNYQSNPNSLADNMQDLQINRPRGPSPTMPNALGPRPPPFSTQPFSSSAPSVPPFQPPASFAGASPVSRPGPSPSGFPRAVPPPTGPMQGTLAPNLTSGRPSGPPFSQPRSLGPRPPPPGAFPPAAMTTGPVVRPSNLPGPNANGPVMFAQGVPPGGPHFPTGITQHQQVRPPPPMSSSTAPQFQGAPTFPGSPPAGAPLGPPGQAPYPFAAASQGMQPGSAPPYGSQTWQMHSLQVSFRLLWEFLLSMLLVNLQELLSSNPIELLNMLIVGNFEEDWRLYYMFCNLDALGCGFLFILISV